MGGVYLMTPTPVGSVWVIFDSTRVSFKTFQVSGGPDQYF
jgi:hypothetical protein